MRIKRKKPKGKYQVKKFPHGGTHSEGELPEEGTMMGDLLRALAASGGKTQYEMTTEKGPFQDWMIKYDATQDQAVDAVRKYYNQYYNLGPARQLLANQLRSQARDIDPNENRPFTDTTIEEFGTKDYYDSTTDVLKALESYGKTSDTLISEYKQSEFDKFKNHMLNFNPRRDDPESYAERKALYAEDPENNYHPDDKFAYFQWFTDYDTEKTSDGRNISDLSKRELRNLTVDDLAWNEQGISPWDYETRRSPLPGDRRYYAWKLVQKTNPTFSKENILKTIEEQPELFSKEDIEDYKGGYGELPTYFERQLDDILYTMSYEDLANMAIQSRTESLDKVPYTLYPETLLSDQDVLPESKDDVKRFYGASYPKTDDYDPFMVGVGLTPTQQVRDTALEEISHTMDSYGQGDRTGEWASNLNLTPGEAKILQDIVDVSWERFFEQPHVKETYPGGRREAFGYSGPGYDSPAEYARSPTEVVARIRVLKNLSGKFSNYTQEDLDKIEATLDTSGHPDKQYARALEQLREAEGFSKGDGFTDEEILKLMNSIYKQGGFIAKKKKPKVKYQVKKFPHGGTHTEDESSDIDVNDFSIMQALTNIYNWRENLAENINPRAYGFLNDDDAPGRDDPILENAAIQRLYNAIVLDRKEPLRESEEEMIEFSYDPSNPDYSSNVAVEAERQDLLNLMLGQNQKHNSIEPAIYKPTKSKDADAKYYRSKVTEEQIKDRLNIYSKKIGQDTNVLLPFKTRLKDFDMTDLADIIMAMDSYGAVLGNYTLDQGVDEKGHYISYYDKWDVNPLSSSGSQGDATSIMSRGLDNIIQSAVGITPAELYGRVYYDPETGQPIDEKKYGGYNQNNKEKNGQNDPA